MGLLGDIMDVVSVIGNLTMGGVQANENAKTQQQNLGFQREQLAYQKSMQEQAWAREDNAVSRRMADLKRAGINPILAAGSAASSSGPIQVITPHKEPVDYSPISRSVQDAMSLMMMRANIANTIAQNKLINAQADKVTADTLLTKTQTQKETKIMEHNDAYGIAPDASGWMKTARDVSDMLSKGWNMIFHKKKIDEGKNKFKH